MFLCLFYSVTINESKVKFRKVFLLLFSYKNIAAPSSSSNFLVKLRCRGIVVFACLDESNPMSL